MLLAAVGFRAYATARGVPLLAADARVFLPQTVSFHERGELINHVWSGAAKLDRTGERRMVYHGFLFPMVLGKMMWRGDYLTLARCLAILQTIATLLPGVLLLILMKRWQWELTARRVLLVLLLMVAGANYTQGSLGRPDVLAAVIVSAGLASIAAAPQSWHKFIAGISIGLVTAAAPVVGVLSGLLFAGYAAWRWQPRRCLIETAAAALLAGVVFAGCFWCYPYSLGEWWDGTMRMGSSAFSQAAQSSSVRSFFYDYVARGSSWFLGVALALALWSVWRMRQRSAGAASPLLFYGALILLAAALVRFVFYISWARYNLLPLMPLGFLAVFHELGRARAAHHRPLNFYPRVAFGILLILSFGFVGDLYERAHTLRFGLDLPQARERFAALRARSPAAIIGLHQSLFTLTEERGKIIFNSTAATIPAEAMLWLQPQAHSRDFQPPPIAGFRLLENYFNPQPVSLFGRSLWSGDRSCGFAVYERDAE